MAGSHYSAKMEKGGAPTPEFLPHEQPGALLGKPRALCQVLAQGMIPRTHTPQRSPDVETGAAPQPLSLGPGEHREQSLWSISAHVLSLPLPSHLGSGHSCPGQTFQL